MAISQGNTSSGPYGLNLSAWALIDGAAGTNLKSQGVASTTRVSTGLYRATLNSAVSLQAQVVARVTSPFNNPEVTISRRMFSATVAEVSIRLSGAPNDVDGIHVEVWA